MAPRPHIRFKLYNVNGNTIYKHIFANGEPVADVRGVPQPPRSQNGGTIVARA
jgi:hypothetical protein